MRPAERRAGRAAAALARVLLALYPASFRDEAGAALLRDVRRRAIERRRVRGVSGFILWWLQTAASLIVNAVGAWTDRGIEAPRLRPTVRGLARTPGFSLTVVLTLALGIGATTAVFGALRAVLLQPLPYADPASLVRLYMRHVDAPAEREYVTGPHYLFCRENARSFQDVAATYTYASTGVDLMLGDQAERVRTLRVSPQYFRVLRRSVMLGRTFTRNEEHGEPLAIVSERLWRRLDAATRHLGMSLTLDGVRRSLIGVMPADFQDPLVHDVQVWLPLELHDGGATNPDNFFLTILGRLAPGVTPAQARGEMAQLDRALAARYPDEARLRFALVPLQADLTASARPLLLLLFGAVALVLVIVCVNVANLQMVRALSRVREVAVRSALGARRSRIAGELLTEGLLLALVGGACGVVVAIAGVHFFAALGAGALPRNSTIQLNVPVLGFAAGLSIVTGLAFGVVPALRLSRTDPAAVLHASAAAAAGEAGSRHWLRILVAGQVALAFVLLTGASVLAVSITRLEHVDLGVRTDHVLTFQLNLPDGRYDTGARRVFHQAMVTRLAAVPGIRASAAVSWLPAAGSGYRWGVFVESGPLAGAGDDESHAAADQRLVAGDYFAVLGIPLVAGRLFDSRERTTSGARTVVVGRSVAERLFPGVPAVGGRVRIAGVERVIVGVVGDVARDAEGDMTRIVYQPLAQNAGRNWAMTYLLRVNGDPLRVVPAVRAAVASVDPQLVVYQPATLDSLVGQGRARRQFAFVLMAVFATLAVTLAALGLYGVLAHVVGRRRREIGIRLALGATEGHLAALVLRDSLRMVVPGLALGVLASLALGRLLETLVFHTAPTDPHSMAAAAAILGLTALLASAIPAWRAVRVSPRTTLAEG